MLSSAHIDVVRIIKDHERVVLVRLTNPDQSIRLRIRQRLKDNRIDQAEDGGVSPDAEAQDEDSGDGFPCC
jgi:hypothetical protein